MTDTRLSNPDRAEPQAPRAPDSRPQSGCSLALILLLFVVVATLLAATRLAWVSAWDPNNDYTLGVAALGAFLGGVVGIILGLVQPRKAVSTLIGLLSGFAFGAMIGVLLAVPEACLTVAVGSAILVAFAALVRSQQRTPPVS